MQQLKEILISLGISCDEEMIEKFRSYEEGILQWNEKINLTRITEHREFVVKHFIDSIICCGYPEFHNAASIVDVGTGAGFPGVPLAIVAPDKDFVLMDSLNKRLKIVNERCIIGKISNVKTVHGRAEELARNKLHRQRYDLCVSRAVANLAVLSEYCLPFIKVGGYLLAYKGPEADHEIQTATSAIEKLGGKLLEVRQVPLQEFELDHNILVIKKIKDTPSKYPRKAGTPAKEPLK